MKKIAVLVFFVLSALLAGILADKLMRSDEISKSDEAGKAVAKQEEVKEAGNGKTEKIGGLEWSELFSFEDDICWRNAFEYCENLEKNGHTDWRLPNIDELRMIIKNCPATESGGSCRVSEEKGCLSRECGESCSCEKKEDNGGYYNRLGDNSLLWPNVSYPVSLDNRVWVVDFKSAGIIEEWGNTENFVHNIRCVRQDEHEMCKTAKKYATLYYWNFYFEHFPNGECAGEAKVFLDNEDGKKCAAARTQNTRASWEQYLRSFPNGKCAEEGMAVINKFRIIDGIEWSNISTDRILGYEAEDYCKNLKENGHDDWKMPEIDHLRMLIQNHPGTAAGGRCKISQNRSATYDYSKSCNGIKGSNFSKLGDTVELLSSTSAETVTRTNVYVRDYWIVDFNKGEIDMEIMSLKMHVRCIRCEEAEDCSTFYSEEINTKNQLKKIGNLEWSSAFRGGSCEELVEDGHSDWRLPNIDELRTLIQNHPGTVSGGKCKISERNGTLYDEVDKNCYGIEGDDFSKLGDTGWLWSSSPESEGDLYWAVYFNNGGLAPFRRTVFSFFQRCVRQDDLDACETAQTYRNLYYWQFYLENYPKGKCAVEAKNFLKKRDEVDCDDAKKGYSGWDSYLKNFPDGGCVKEAKKALEKEACEKARKEDDVRYWKNYLKDYPEGECVAEAKASIDPCKIAKEQNSLVSWTSYLKESPDGKCSEEAKTAIKKMKKVGNLEWSDISNKEISWKNAVDYCKQLREDGYSDWRLPDIDELRTIVQNCPNTETGGICKVSRKSGCLSGKCLNDDESCGCIFKWGSCYSKFGDGSLVSLWSSSVNPDDAANAWQIDFSSGRVRDYNKSFLNHVRCVR